jgi:hypothetical protein
MSCPHENFVAACDVIRLQEEEGQGPHSFVMKAEVRCADCGAPFAFKGPPVGLSWSEPRVSMDARTLHAPLMSPSEQQLAGPRHALDRGPMVYEAP